MLGRMHKLLLLEITPILISCHHTNKPLVHIPNVHPNFVRWIDGLFARDNLRISWLKLNILLNPKPQLQSISQLSGVSQVLELIRKSSTIESLPLSISSTRGTATTICNRTIAVLGPRTSTYRTRTQICKLFAADPNRQPIFRFRFSFLFSARTAFVASAPWSRECNTQFVLQKLKDLLFLKSWLGNSLHRVVPFLVRGISGGERRRVSIGVDVIHDPRVLILDEPTSGLDSTSALQTIDMLKVMAETRGRTIILSIHQPGFRIVKMFNSILLLSNGCVLHHGTVDQLGVHMRNLGLQLPMHVNVVEYAIDSIELIQRKLQQEIQPQVVSSAPQQKIGEDQMGESKTDFANSRLQETIILTHRFSKNIFRTKELFACRTIQMLVSGFVLGSIFYNVKDDLLGAEEKVGLFAFILTFLLSCTTEALPVFLQEREILMRETSCGSYRVSSYAIANGLVYLPFLLTLAILFTIPLYWLVGLNPNFMAFMHFLLLIWLILYTANSVVVCFSALVPNFIVGNSVISGVMGSFFLFSGYFISKHGIPNYWIFIHYISLFKYPFEGFLINEFSASEKCFQYIFGKCMVTGEDVLREAGYEEKSRWRNLVIMVGFILVYRFISYVILSQRKAE
ncbi:hypothetical protein JRO89_XS08G0084500 [Xanthoceras sorbifolium]|uniref:ABC transporter domain-containing protein n=1 Tax=Xanthoceras sorbifolium TaxID=99658 RepID=A0ABQ8HP32_9ROSI|nr:hypothetical protein JRO89_XS08G0084500 [Xanthoceras sorbifolium]